jgi:thiol-disulfide isomerase/thioredoxin
MRTCVFPPSVGTLVVESCNRISALQLSDNGLTRLAPFSSLSIRGTPPLNRPLSQTTLPDVFALDLAGITLLFHYLPQELPLLPSIMSTPSNVVSVIAPDHFQSLLSQDLQRISLINFWASWAAPCVQINEVVLEIARKYPQLLVLQVARIELFHVASINLTAYCVTRWMQRHKKTSLSRLTLSLYLRLSFFRCVC